MVPNAPAELTVVIPAWNEADNLRDLIPSLHQALKEIQVPAQILVVDGGSRDGTAQVATQLGARAIQQVERGYGGALLAGFAAAQTPFVATMDADQSHPADFLRRFWAARHQADMMIASRYVPGGKAEMSTYRYVLSRILNATFSVVLSLPVKDVSSGFRFYTRRTLDQLTLHSRDFDVLEEILVVIFNKGFTVKEIPFHYLPRVSGQSHARLIKFAIAYLKTLWRMWKLRHGWA